MIKKRYLFLMLLVCLFAISSVSATENIMEDIGNIDETGDEVLSMEYNNPVIDSFGDENDLLSANPDGSFTDLANEIANSTGELKLTKNYVYDSKKDSNYKNGIIIDKEITINGRGFVINGNNNVRAFNVVQEDVTLRNIKFINCSISSDGGAIYWNGADGNLYDCIFEDCYTSSISSDGGAIYWNGVNGNLHDCDFKDCYASSKSSSHTSSSSSVGGVIYWNGANGKLYDCTFKDCYASSKSSSSAITASSVGGVIYWNGANGNLHDSTFDDCYSICSSIYSRSSSSVGGAVYWNGANGNFLNCNFTNCYCYCYNTHTGVYYSYSYGGAVYWNGTSGSLLNCNFKKSNSISKSEYSKYSEGSSSPYSYSYGGAVYWNGASSSILNCNFEDCYCYSYSYGNNSVYGDSYSYSCGGAVYWNGASSSILNCNFTRCYSSSYSSAYSISSSKSSWGYSYSYGGAVYWNGDNSNLLNCNFEDCYSSSSSYGSSPADSSFFFPTSDCTESYSYGGAVCWNGKNGNVTSSIIKNCHVNGSGLTKSSGSENHIYRQSHNIYLYGGAIYWRNDDGCLSDCNFINSNIKSDDSLIYGCGGAVYWNGKNGNILSSNFTNNKIIYKGYAKDVYWKGHNGYLYDCNFINSGSSSVYENSVYWEGNEGNLIYCSFNGNYYGYDKSCKTIKPIYPLLEIHTHTLNNDNNIISFESTPLINNISVSIYNVTGRIKLYKQFNISSKDLTSSLNLNNLSEGEYQIVLKYDGDKFYSAINKNDLFTIGKNSSFEVKINNPVLDGDNVIISLTLNEDATGKVKITLANYTSINELVGGKTSFNIPNVLGGIHTYQIKYAGDSQYNPLYINNTFNVLFKSHINLNFKNNIVFDKKIALTYNITPMCTGIISIFIDNVFKTNISVDEVFELENIDVGKYNITFIYQGDECFAASKNSKILTVSKANPSINVNSSNYPGGLFEVILNKKATGNINITLNKISYYKSLINGKTSIIIPNLNVGKYPVKIIYNGDKNYNLKIFDTSLTINKMPATVNGTVDDITFTQNAIINVKCIIDSNVVVKIDKNYIKNVNVVANTVTPVTFENIPAGKHNVTITSNPTNPNYEESTYTTEFTVYKKETSINLNVVDSIYGEEVIVNVTASEDGVVILKVGNITREKNVLANSLTKINLGVLAANSYIVDVNFDAGENYKSSNKKYNIDISPAKAEILNLQSQNNVYGENTIIKVKTSVGGSLTFKVGSIIKSFDIVANKLTAFNFGILDVNTYAVEVKLDAGNNYIKPISTTQVTIDSKQTSVNVDVKNSTYGENVIVNVSASENGKISVNIGNIIKQVNVEANKKYSVDFSILNAKSYDVHVTFDGGNNYKKSYNNTFLIVSPAKSKITEIKAQDNVYGENTIIKVKTSLDGVLTVTINTITKKVNVKANQLTILDFGILNAYNYEVGLNFNAGNNYIQTNVTKTFKVLKADPTISVAVNNATYGQKAKVIINSNADGNATIEIGSVKSFNNVLFKNNQIIQDVAGIDAGTYAVKVIYNGNNNYNFKIYDAKLTINKASSTTVATVNDITYLQNAIINVKCSVDGIFVVKIDENYIKNVNVLANTVTPVTFDNIPAGKHKVSITLNPSNKNYKASSFNTDFTVSKKSTSVDLNVVDVIYGEESIVNVIASENGRVTLNVGNIVREKSILANNLLQISLGLLASGTYDVNVVFSAGDNYKNSSAWDNFVIYPLKSNINTIDVSNNIYGENTIIKVKTNVSGVVSVKIGDNIKYLDVIDNKLFEFNFGLLNANSYDVEITLDAGKNYTKTTNRTQIVISPKETNIILKVENISNTITLTASVNPSSATGNVVFNINGKEQVTTIKDSNAIINLKNLATGNYSVKATYNGDTNHKSSISNSVSFDVEEIKYDIFAPDVIKYYKGPERFVVTLKDLNGKAIKNTNVKININGRPYDRVTDENGIASMGINLNSGKYNVTTEYGGKKVYSTIIIKDTVIANDFTKIFRNGTKYQGTFVDSQGNLIKNTDVKININGVFYTRKTDGNGVAKMNINLPSGTYILTATNPLSGEQHTTKITVLPSIVENHDLTKYYKNASKYTLRIIGDDGKPVGEGVTVKLNINGVFYERKTNATGYMNMNINLPPGTYTVTAEYNGLRASNKITILSVLETKDLVMKYRDGSKFEAKILDGQGRPYAGQTVKFNINGVFYTKTTESDGIARLNINLLAGEYIITSMYNGLNAANKVTISG